MSDDSISSDTGSNNSFVPESLKNCFREAEVELNTTLSEPSPIEHRYSSALSPSPSHSIASAWEDDSHDNFISLKNDNYFDDDGDSDDGDNGDDVDDADDAGNIHVHVKGNRNDHDSDSNDFKDAQDDDYDNASFLTANSDEKDEEEIEERKEGKEVVSIKKNKKSQVEIDRNVTTSIIPKSIAAGERSMMNEFDSEIMVEAEVVIVTEGEKEKEETRYQAKQQRQWHSRSLFRKQLHRKERDINKNEDNGCDDVYVVPTTASSWIFENRIYQCSSCRKNSGPPSYLSPTSFHRCPECLQVYYCSETCQRKHSIEHDTKCKILCRSSRGHRIDDCNNNVKGVKYPKCNRVTCICYFGSSYCTNRSTSLVC